MLLMHVYVLGPGIFLSYGPMPLLINNNKFTIQISLFWLHLYHFSRSWTVQKFCEFVFQPLWIKNKQWKSCKRPFNFDRKSTVLRKIGTAIFSDFRGVAVCENVSILFFSKFPSKIGDFVQKLWAKINQGLVTWPKLPGSNNRLPE